MRVDAAGQAAAFPYWVYFDSGPPMRLRLRQLWDWMLDRQPAAPKSTTSRAMAPKPAVVERSSLTAGRAGGHTSETQWGCVARVMQAAIDTADRARELQEQAALQIDSATYAFGSLLEELSAVMPVTGVEGSWGKRATVHALAPARVPPRRALAA